MSFDVVIVRVMVRVRDKVRVRVSVEVRVRVRVRIGLRLRLWFLPCDFYVVTAGDDRYRRSKLGNPHHSASTRSESDDGFAFRNISHLASSEGDSCVDRVCC